MGSLHRTRDRVRIIERLRGMQPNDQPKWRSISPHKLMAHLVDSFALSARKKDGIKPGEGSRSSALGKWIVIRSPMPWPKGLKVLDVFWGTQASEFTKDHERVITAIESYAQDPKWGVSPALGRLTAKQSRQLNFRHCQHHLKQLGR